MSEQVPEMSGSGESDAFDVKEVQPQIKGYEIVGPVGGGGMGRVWRAVKQSTGEQVALKVISERLADSALSREMFQREVRACARMDHPNIAKLLDSGVQNGVYFYAMELVDGRPIDQYVRELKPHTQTVLQLMLTVAGAVQHAHEQGVVHRDLKPANILVDSRGHPHVVDFGLAQFHGEQLAISGVEATIGTLAYMPPEQAAGRLNEVTARSDVYSLGATLYVLLTGQTPHETTGDRAEIIRRITTQPARRPRVLNPILAPEIEQIMMKSTMQDPQQRYATAGELAEDLHHLLSGAKPGVAGFAGQQLDMHRLVEVLSALRDGDFSKRLPRGSGGQAGDVARILNGIMQMLDEYAAEQRRIVEEVGTRGWLGGQMEIEATSRGAWADWMKSTNQMGVNLTIALRNMARVARSARERLPLPPRIGCPVRGEIADLYEDLRVIAEERVTSTV